MSVQVVSLTIDRTSLELDDLVITNDFSEDLWIAAIQEPGFEFRYLYAPDSDYIPGSQLLAAVLEQSSLPCVIYAQGASAAALRTVRDEVAAAVSQWAYDLTLSIDGDSATFAADPVWPKWANGADSGMVAAHLASTPLTFRVNPPGA